MARQTKLVLPKDEKLVVKIPISPTNLFIVTTKGNRSSGHSVWAGQWFFPSCSKLPSTNPAWVRGLGFNIPHNEAAAWKRGFEKLLTIKYSDLEKYCGLFVYELRFGRPGLGGPRHSIRFYIHRIRGETGYYYVFAQFVRDKKDKWIRTPKSHVISVEWGKKTVKSIIKALDEIVELSSPENKAADILEVCHVNEEREAAVPETTINQQ